MWLILIQRIFVRDTQRLLDCASVLLALRWIGTAIEVFGCWYLVLNGCFAFKGCGLVEWILRREGVLCFCLY